MATASPAAARRLSSTTAGSGDRLRHRAADELDVGGLVARHPQLLDGGAWLRGDVEDDLADVDRADAVDHRLVALGQHRRAAAGEALDEVHLPERAGVVERPRHQPRDQLRELLVRARLGQGRAADVVGDVEFGVVDPDRPREVARHVPDLLPVARHQRDPLLDELDEPVVVEARLRPPEDRHRADVHRRARFLQVEEGGVEGGEPGRHGAILGWRGGAAPLSQGHLHHGLRPHARAGGVGRRGAAGGQGDPRRRPARRAGAGDPRRRPGARCARGTGQRAPGEGARGQRAARPGGAGRRRRAAHGAGRRVPRSARGRPGQGAACWTGSRTPRTSA